MMRLLSFMIFFMLFLGLMAGLNSCDRARAQIEHDDAIHGCTLIGTIEGYKMGREGVPAQEQWKCGDVVKTVNAVK